MDCNTLFHEECNFLSSPKTMTIQKDMKILEALKDINSAFKSVAARFEVSDTYVQNIFDLKVDISRLKLPKILCVDEVYSKKLSYHKYCFILYAPQFKKIVDVLDSRHKENLEQYFHNISLNERKNVQFFSIDLYDTYRAIGKKYFPNAIICADAFHVIKNLSNLKYSHDNYYWLLKRYPKLLTRDKSKLGYTKFKYYLAPY